MELLLNALWLLIAAVIFAAISLVRTDRRQWQIDFVAVVCVCILLLPVISITDDLNSGTFTVEDFTTSKKLLNHSVDPPLAPILLWFTIPLIAIFVAVQCRRRWRQIEEIAEPYPDPPGIRLILSRAPPVSRHEPSARSSSR